MDHAFEKKYYGPNEEIPEEGNLLLQILSLDMADAELKRIAEHEDNSKGRVSEFRPIICSLMLGLSPSDCVLRAISNVHTNHDLEQTLLDDVDLLEMYLISKNIGKHFVVSSRSPGNCDWFLHLTETTTSFGHVALLVGLGCLVIMTCDMDLGFNVK
uniref:WD-repeat protein n=1 Tax=Solanum tuberosum TaxID=4113 RepID=M1DDP1_SOLTU